MSEEAELYKSRGGEKHSKMTKEKQSRKANKLNAKNKESKLKNTSADLVDKPSQRFLKYNNQNTVS